MEVLGVRCGCFCGLMWLLSENPEISDCVVFKSGPLFISSKGELFVFCGLVSFYGRQNELPQRGGEVNLTLGGIDLNNSGSVVVREDKRLLTVLFPDGRDGRAFTLKAETSEDLYEWKTALEHALAQAPSPALVMGHNGIFRNDTADTIDGSFHQWRDKHPVKSLVVGRPILLALEDIDGSPSFLEKALRFLEKYGTKVEGILRQAADVEEVERRVLEYEQGKKEFCSDEDAHVVGDCVKHVLRELPSSPVPASCCTALLEAYSKPILILKMMHTVAAHSSENRMSPSAVAACMAPLLLRPLLAGECELEDEFDMNGDSSAQLLAAANAANNAQAIITALLEEYESIFDVFTGDNLDTESPVENHIPVTNLKLFVDSNDSPRDSTGLHNYESALRKESESSLGDRNSPSVLHANESHRSMGELLSSVDPGLSLPIPSSESSAEKITNKVNGSSIKTKRSTFWGRNTARKNASVDSIDSSGEEELAIQRLEITKNELRNRIAREAKGNAILQASLERRKQALHERRLALEQDVCFRLQEQLQAERDLRAALEVGLSMSAGQFSNTCGMDSKTRAELEEIALAEADVARLKQKVTELHLQLNRQRQQHYSSLTDATDRYQHTQHLHSQLKFLQQDFDMNLAFCNHERKQRSEESPATDWRNVKAHVTSPAGNSKLFARKQGADFMSPGDSKSTEASTSISADELSAIDSAASMPSTSRAMVDMEHQRQPVAASSTLVELTTRLDFFKERRSQLMEQLHNLDLNYGSASSQGMVYNPSSPPWS
ncbi:hypothetical protein Sjap_002127 [Stephania japonica]|uniref:Rho GTPase-activating protein 7 n=1 Tax=Stephania japonica TaxID=461633 RepID=A0AAP0KL86_9MAGN